MANSISARNKTYRYRPPLPVDRGWAWLIMLAGYANIMLATAFGRSLSIFLPDILERYQQPATVTTLAFGLGDLSWSLTNIAIPTLLLPRFSIRSLAIFGAFIYCLSVIALAYSPNIIVFNCIFAVVGVADGLIVVLSLIHLGHFFKKRLSFASAVIHAGGSTATVIMPLLARYLLDKFGFQGALLILAGLSFNCVAASMLLRPLSMYDDGKSVIELQMNNSANDHPKSSLDDTQIEMQYFINAPDDEEVNEESKFLHNKDPENEQIRGLTLPIDLDHKLTGWTDIKNGSLHNSEKEVLEERNIAHTSEADVTKSISEKSVHKEVEFLSLLPKTASFTNENNHNNTDSIDTRSSAPFNDAILSNSSASFRNNDMEEKGFPADECEHYSKASPMEEPLTMAYDHQLCAQISQNVEDTSSQEKRLLNGPVQTDNDGSKHILENEEAASSSGRWSIRKIKASLSSSVLLNPVAVMLILAGGLSTSGGNMYFPVLGLENGLSSDEVPWMLTIIGVADIVGKLGIGYFADLGYLRQIRIVCMTQLTVGMICQFTMFYTGFGQMAAMAAVFGLTAGIIHALLVPMVIEMVGLLHLAQITSLFYLTSGIFTFVLNVSFGALRDATGSFVGGYNLLGSMYLTSLVILLLEPVFVRCRDKSDNHSSDRHNKSGQAHNDVI